jgi:hypothetical protein
MIARTLPAAAALLLLAVVWLLAIAPPLALIGAEQARSYNEGWNTVKQKEVLDRLALYREPPGLTLTNYPPLSYHLIATVSAVTGLPLLEAGRLVSLAAFLACCALVAVAAARLGAGRVGAIAAGLGFGVIAVAAAPRFVAVNEPHLLGLALVLAGLVLHLAPRGPRVAWAALCFAAALAVKFCFVGAALAIAVDLTLRREFRVLARYVLWGGLAGSGFAAWALLGEGPHALGQLFVPRSVSIYTMILNVTLVLPVVLPLLLGAGLALVAALREPPPRVALLASLAVLPWPVTLFFAAGHGVASAIFLEAIALTTIAFFAAIGPGRAAAASLSGGLSLLLPAAGAAAVVLVAAWDHLREAPERERLATLRQEAIAFIAASPGPAMCEDILLCHQAGKPHLYDAYAVDNAIRVGELDKQGIVQLFRERRFGAIQLGVDREVHLHRAGGWMRFPEPVAEAIRASYRPVLLHPRMTVLAAQP